MKPTPVHLIAIAVAILAVVTAAAGFQSGSSPAMGWFIVLGLAGASALHHLVLAWLRKDGGRS